MLIVGTNKQPILDNLPHNYLFIDDGEFTDDIAGHHFVHTIHHFNPLANLDYKRARDFVSILNSIFPEGENTLTRKNSNYILLRALLDRPRKLSTLLSPSNDPAEQDAYQKIQTLLLSPVLKNVLLGQHNYYFRGRRLARLNRAELGDFDCFVLGNLLMSLYQGHIVVPDYGFYAAPHHTTLIRQNRLTAGVNYLAELPPKLRNLLLLGDKLPAHCTFDDAETLALYSGIARGTNAFTDFVTTAIK